MVSLLADIAICAAILAGAYFWVRQRSSAGLSSSSSKKKKNKSKSKAKAAANDVAPAVVSGKQLSQQQPAKQANLEKEKPAAVQPAPQEQSHVKNGANQKPKPQQPTKNRHTQGQAWRANEEFPPLSAAMKQSSQAQKPLAERHAKPVPKTAVDDMLDREVEPERTFSRTMRIVKPAPSPPLLIDEPVEEEKDSSDPFGEGDSRIEKEAAWESVPITSQKKPPTIRIGISPASSGTSTPVRSIPGLTEQSKKQRQNAAKAAAAKAAKDAAEQDRLQRLAMHKRQLEKERMTTQAKEREKANGKARSNRETLSGGMTAKVAENGALIWD